MLLLSGSGVSPGSQPRGYRAAQAPHGQASQEAVFLVTAPVDSQAPGCYGRDVHPCWLETFVRAKLRLGENPYLLKEEAGIARGVPSVWLPRPPGIQQHTHEEVKI